MFPWNSIPGPLALCANLYQTSYHVGWQDTLCYSKTTDTYRQMLKYNTIFITLISQIICISFFIVLSNTNHKIGTKTTKKKNKHTKHSHLFRRNKNFFFLFFFWKKNHTFHCSSISGSIYWCLNLFCRKMVHCCLALLV
jgi:hypothetical protein